MVSLRRRCLRCRDSLPGPCRGWPKSFWDDLFNCYGKNRQVASFEAPVRMLNGNLGYIDLLWKAAASEMANSQYFVKDLTALLGLPQPTNNHLDGYSFNFPVKVPGTAASNFLDLFRYGIHTCQSLLIRQPPLHSLAVRLLPLNLQDRSLRN